MLTLSVMALCFRSPTRIRRRRQRERTISADLTARACKHHINQNSPCELNWGTFSTAANEAITFNQSPPIPPSPCTAAPANCAAHHRSGPYLHHEQRGLPSSTSQVNVAPCSPYGSNVTTTDGVHFSFTGAAKARHNTSIQVSRTFSRSSRALVEIRLHRCGCASGDRRADRLVSAITTMPITFARRLI